MKIVLFVLMSLSFGSAKAIPMSPEKGNVEFLAVGKPAFVKIKGEGQGPTGQFQLKKVGSEFILNAELIVDLRTLKTGIELRDNHMKEKYLLTPQYNSATLKLKMLFFL